MPEERLARALNVNISNIRHKKALLDGIRPEAAELMKDKHVPNNTIGQLKQLKPIRQIEAVDLMIAMNKFTVSYARSLVVATQEAQLQEEHKRTERRADCPYGERDGPARTRVQDHRAGYATDHLDVVLATGYVARLLGDARVVRHLPSAFPDVLAEFQKIAEF